MVVDDWSNCGIARGDWILEINGQELAGSRETLAIVETLVEGDTVQLLVDDGAPQTVSCSVVRPSASIWQLPNLLAHLAFAAVVLLVLRVGPLDAGSLGFCLLGVGMAIGTSSGAVAPSYLGITHFFAGYCDERLLSTAFSLVTVGFIPFTLYSPFPLPGIARAKWLPPVFLPLAVFALLAGSVIGLVFGELATLQWNETMVTLALLVSVLGVVLHGWRARYARTPTLKLRQRAGVLVQSALMFGFVAVFFVAYQGGGFGLSFMAECGLGLACCIPFALSSPLVLLDFDRIILQSWIARFVRVLLAVFVVVVAFEILVFTGMEIHWQLVLSMALAIVVDLIAAGWLRRWELRSRGDVSNRLASLNRLLQEVSQSPLKSMAEVCARSLQDILQVPWISMMDVEDAPLDNASFVMLWTDDNEPVAAIATEILDDSEASILLSYFAVGAASAQEFAAREVHIGGYRHSREAALGRGTRRVGRRILNRSFHAMDSS
ncbi:MAG: hypothetical protein AAF654_07340 [Myxococcota bacterium]